MGSVKRSRVVVPWEAGLHLRPAARLVRLAYTFRSAICLKCGQRAANLRSVLSVVMLCAAMGTPLDVEASGDDEDEAVAAIEQEFALDPAPIRSATEPSTRGVRESGRSG